MATTLDVGVGMLRQEHADEIIELTVYAPKQDGLDAVRRSISASSAVPRFVRTELAPQLVGSTYSVVTVVETVVYEGVMCKYEEQYAVAMLWAFARVTTSSTIEQNSGDPGVGVGVIVVAGLVVVVGVGSVVVAFVVVTVLGLGMAAAMAEPRKKAGATKCMSAALE